MKALEGRVHRVDDDVDTDRIIPARHCTSFAPADLAPHALEDYDPELAARVQPGDVLVAGANFGCGSSREHAPVALRACGFAGVVAASFARIFYRNAVNIGLPVLVCPAAAAGVRDGATITADLESGRITDHETGQVFAADPVSEAVAAVIAAGGLVPLVRARLAGAGEPEGV